MQTYGYIKKWGDIYQKVVTNEYDLSFGVFMTAPKGYLKEIGQEYAPECIENGFEPLLHAQAKVVLRLREEGGDIEESEKSKIKYLNVMEKIENNSIFDMLSRRSQINC